MIELNNKELKEIVGGIAITGTLITAAIKVYNAVLAFGQNFGSSLRRAFTGSVCNLK